MKKYELLDGKVFLLVPVLHERCSRRLNLTSRLVYGWLVYRSRREAGASCPGLAVALGIDKATARRATVTLKDLGLAEKRGHTWFALAPASHNREMFRFLSDPDGPWQAGFVYDKTFFPAPDCPFGLQANALLWRLVKNAKPVSDMPNHLFVQKPRYLTITYLANGLHCDPQTARRALAELQKAELVHVVHSDSRRKGFQVGIKFRRGCQRWWRDGWRPDTTIPLTARQLFKMPSTLEIKEDITAQPECYRSFRREGIPSSHSARLTAKIERYLIPPREWNAMLWKVRGDHATNREDRPKLPSHCGFLFEHELDKLIETKQRVQDRYSCRPRYSEEMKAEYEVSHLANGEPLFDLLRYVIPSRELHMDNGDVVPLATGWESIEQIAKKSKGDREQFKEQVLIALCGSTERFAAPWYRHWMKA